MSSDMSTKRATQERFLEGYVVSDKMNKTIVVEVLRTFKHPLLGKIIRKSKRYKVHDEQMTAKDGDLVKIVETRPISKTKHMRLVEVIRSVRQGA